MTRRALAGALLIIAAAWTARAAPDVTVPGAQATLGFGGGFWVGAWSEFRLEASAPGAFTATLRVDEGQLRSGLTPVTAVLSVPDEPGVRVAKLSVPIMSRRRVTVNLSGPTGRASARIDPFTGTPGVSLSLRVGAITSYRGERVLELTADDLTPNPALWLAGPDLLVADDAVAPDATRALAWLAGGGHVVTPTGRLRGLEPVPTGPIGLGRLERVGDGGPASSGPRLEALAASLVPSASPPTRRNAWVGAWAVAGFLVCLGAYSARRLDARATTAAAAAAVAFGVVGAWFMRPVSTLVESDRTVSVGASGWGVAFTVASRVTLEGGEVVLPAASKPITDVPRRYEARGVLVEQPAWSRVSYWTEPRAARLPLRVVGDRVENVSDAPLAWVYVVGAGPQEPLAAGRSRVVSRVPSAPAPAELSDLVPLLPSGTAVAGVNGGVVVALPAP